MSDIVIVKNAFQTSLSRLGVGLDIQEFQAPILVGKAFFQLFFNSKRLQQIKSLQFIEKSVEKRL